MKILAIGAHLDDIEIAVGGVLAKSVLNGHKVKALIMSKSGYTDRNGNVQNLNIESHYLFHPVPIKGTHSYRMSIDRFLDFSRLLTASGEISGRSKPMFSLMTDVGKVTLYEGTIGEKDAKGYYDIKTGYRLAERQKWHKNYILPQSAYEDEEGYLHVRYLDGSD